MGPGNNSDYNTGLTSLPSIFSNMSTGDLTGDPDVSPMSQDSPVITKLNHVNSDITTMKEPLDDTNWIAWHGRICRIFLLCGVAPYVYGNLKRPDPTSTDPEILGIWDKNDVYAQLLITNNITTDQMAHVTHLETAHAIWNSLKAIHDPPNTPITDTIRRALFRQHASDGDDIAEHLTELKRKWVQFTTLNDDPDTHITDMQFKTIVATSLPPSWDTFMKPYEGITDKPISLDEFINILRDEYVRRRLQDRPAMRHETNANHIPNQATTSAESLSAPRCDNCGHRTHTTAACRWLGKPQCTKCGWFGHLATSCRRRQKRNAYGSSSNGLSTDSSSSRRRGGAMKDGNVNGRY